MTHAPMSVAISGLQVRVDTLVLLDGVDLTVRPGAVCGLVGPNGSGKSTLLRAVYRSLRPSAGVCRVGDDDLWQLSPRDSARRVAVLPQDEPLDIELCVRDVVRMGRLPHQRALAADSDLDRAVVEQALARADVAQLAHRSVQTLSGGERQRVLLARALTQDTPVLVLDEPTNHLDVCHQLELLELVRSMGVTTLVALHDLNLAHAYCDQIAVLADGKLLAAGDPADVLTPELVGAVFKLGCHRLCHPATGRPLLAFSPLPQQVPLR